MARKPRRIVEAAIVERIGAITAADLLAMPDDSWRMMRSRITDTRNGGDNFVARCMACNGEVYIRTARIHGVNRPLFAHYAGSDPQCPWYQGRNTAPDDARAAQYQGRQESDFHRLMCEQVAELVALDERYIRHTVEEYLPPTENGHGRFPDVYVEWDGFGPFAVEFQMSGTFQTEISARCKHYEREGIPLLWILFGIETARPLPQSFRDVIHRHRGNAFVLDPAALMASREQKTLVLSCYLKGDEGLDGPRLVRFDELNVPRSKLPYHEDRLVAPRLLDIRQRRLPWFRALHTWERHQSLCSLDREASVLVAAAFSIVAAANGDERNYLKTRQNLIGMLNSQLDEGPKRDRGVISRYARLLTQLIENSSQNILLNSKVGEHLRRATAKQADESSSEWQLLRHLLPEALDPVLREELAYLDALPDWAQPAIQD